MITIAEIRVRPEAAIVENEMVAPSSTTANSRSCLALNAIPGRQRESGSQTLRTAIPIRIAITSASR